MNHKNRELVKQGISLAKIIRNDHRRVALLIKLYWGFVFIFTLLFEKYIPQWINNTDKNILNFGCGNRYLDNAINSDLFMTHRYFKGKRCPDLYWSGLTEI